MKKLILLFFFCLTFIISKANTAERIDSVPPSYILDVNNISAALSPDGSLFWDKSDAYFRVPKSGDVSTIFASALWLGGVDNSGSPMVAANTYLVGGQDYEAGLINDGVTAEDMTRIWKIERSQLKALRHDFENDGIINNPIPTDILEYPAIGNPNAKGANNVTLNITQDYLPFKDTNQDGVYNANDGDLPIIKGDMQLVWFMNDDRPHTQTASSPLLVDIVGFAYANTCSNDIIDNTLFLSFDIYNKNIIDIDSFHIGMWTDYELGCPVADTYGSIPSANSFFIYNQNDIDGAGGCYGIPSYGTQTPIQSVTTLNNTMDYFTAYYRGDAIVSNIGIVEPFIAAEYYYYLTGSWRDGTRLTFGGNGYGGTTPTNYIYPGNPANINDWTANSFYPGVPDDRVITSTGFGTFQLGQKITYDLAYITHENNSPLSVFTDVTPVIQNISQLENWNNNNELDWDVYLSGDDDLLVGQPLTLTAMIENGNPNGNYSYLWSTGETTASITATAPIPYEVTVTNNTTGCWKTDKVYINFPTSTESEISVIDKIQVFPNPATDILTIDVSILENQNLTFSIIDITGKVIKNEIINNETTIQLDVSTLTSGVYFLKMNTEKETIGFKKIVIVD